jgi:pimeloyl-ACP methyl ester carboxylesterase
MATRKSPPPSATRGLKLKFDKNGDIVLESTKSPECFKQSAITVLPPHDVIPVVFVPGVAGSNLKTGKEETWTVPNGAGDIVTIWNTSRRPQKRRQKLFDPLKAEVNPDGPCNIDKNLYWITPEEAKRRGWGTIHAGSYHGFLQYLEKTLNDFVVAPGMQDPDSSALLPEIAMMEYLHGGPPTHLTSSTHADNPSRDYGLKAEEAMAAWGKKPPALTGAEIHRLGSYYYPVWVYGYNWLQDNEESARGLLEYIDQKVLPQYANRKYFKCAGKVIVVTHSMGGLVARRAAQMLDERGEADKILGVVHGAQPVAGAPALYWRMRSGQEASDLALGLSDIEAAGTAVVTAAFMGWSEASMTVQLARAPGPLELAPTCYYPKNWLVVKCRDDRKIFSLPKEDPYAEIYSKTTDDCWWGMVNPKYIDPAGEMGNRKKDPTEEYIKAINKARAFHDKLGLYAHPETYGFYGIDDKKFRSFGHVEWYIHEVFSPDYIKNAEAVKNAKAIKYGSGEVTLPLDYQEDSLWLLHHDKSERKTLTMNFKASLSNARNQRGDGTVPEDSGKVLESLAHKESFALPGFGHQDAFKDAYALQATLYCIARIVQKAPPPTKRKELCR